ncbi:MAG: gamma-glutamyl-gamma-aminobutyrate hydrolase family protein [bacterium]
MTRLTNLPIIGITTYSRNESGNYYLPRKYVDAVRTAGGVPILLLPGESSPSQLLELVDGLIFVGGGDIDPALYGGSNHPTISREDPERDAFELALARQALRKDIPVLGICRGSQLLNVATGGDLVAHVPDEFGLEVLHQGENGEAAEHLVQIAPESRLAKIIGLTELSVVSKHHQGLRTVTPVWRVVAQAPDGVIEALEHKKHSWLLAVLWHPELSLEDPRHQRIFQALIKAASNRSCHL